MSTSQDFIKQEKRRFARIEDNIFIFYRSLRQKEKTEAVTGNISSGGLMFRTDADIKPEDLLELEIYGPVDINKRLIVAIDAMARVAWSKRIEDNIGGGDRFTVGIEFNKIAKEDRNRIMDYITKRKNWRRKQRGI